MLSNWLVAFDFDHTLIDGNSDVQVTKLAPSSEIPPHIRVLHRREGWTAYMSEVFSYLHSNGTTPQQILNCVAEVPFTEGMSELLGNLKSRGARVAIISDSNSEFIRHCLEASGLERCVGKVFTNPAHFNSEGCLCIQMYHLQDWCDLSTKNLCKGYILEEYLGVVGASRVAYIGDGRNDLCPALRLGVNDLVFPRIGFSLMDMINEMGPEEKGRLKAKLHPWKTGFDIWNVLEKHVEEDT